MDLRNPFAAVTPTLDGHVLRVLSQAAGSLSTQQVIDLCAEGSPAGIRKVLHRLVEQGVISELRVGKSYAYSANREHIAWPAVELLANALDRLDEAIAGQVSGWEIQPLSVELFGSSARGESTVESDVDILVAAPALQDAERDRWESQLQDLQESVQVWTGNDVDILDVGPMELVDLAVAGAPVMTDARHRVAGVSTSELLPKAFLEAFAKGLPAVAELQISDSMRRMLAELAPSIEFTPEMKSSLANMTRTLELSQAARAALKAKP
ncbi:nucleotidyltransferase domain-containing protein [Aeromicrobium sp. CF4.19]|uniref:nucleotidyltransferase domain-containing protein n=1 Tax=Aeromicrobium sp. CF4.19 TaxID=3373082 RepID=UPI003EE6254E